MIEPEGEAFLRAVGAREHLAPAEVLEEARRIDPLAAELLDPLLGLVLSPTMIAASSKRNVIPGLCEVIVDCRLLPSQRPADVEPLIRGALGDGDYDLRWIKAEGGTRSPLETPLWDAVESFVEEIEPRATIAPIVVAGFTDSHYLRQAFGTIAYGFFPMRAMTPELAARLIHSADERVPVEDLELGVDFLRHAAIRIGSLSSVTARARRGRLGHGRDR
jgi:acetylornithine deacetylase/succinyl-diaminopimelate desuccinylase-like protein